MLIGEYSNVPELSPIGKLKRPGAVNTFLTSLPPVAMIILEEEKAPPATARADGPRVRLKPLRLRFRDASVSVPLTVTSLAKIASPPDWLIVKFLYVPAVIFCDAP